MLAYLSAVAALCTLALGAWALGRCLTEGDAPLRVRLCATLTSAYFLQAAAFNLLVATHLFRRPVALGLAGLCAAGLGFRLARSPGLRGALVDDLARARGALAGLLRSPLTAAMALTAAGFGSFRLLRGMVSPPLAWDSLTYHLVRPTIWVQQGHDPVERVPDLPGYVTFFPRAGDVPWGWSMLFTGSYSAVPVTGVLVWSTVALAVASLSRELGASAKGATRAGLGAAMIPCLGNIATSGYVDNFVIATFGLAGLWLTRCLRGGDGARGGDPGGGQLVLAAMALSVHAGAKLTGLPLLALGLAVCAIAWWRHGAKGQRPPWVYAALSLGAVALALAPPYLRTIAATGSPLWPLPLKLGGRVLLAGNEQLSMLYAGRLHPPQHDERSPWRFFEALLLPKPRYGPERLDWGEQLAWVVPMALVGIGLLWRRRDVRRGAAAAVLTLLAALPLLATFTEDFITLRTIWGPVAGRLVVALPVMLYALASLSEGALASACWAMVLVASAHAAWPVGTSAPARVAMLSMAPWAGLGLALVASAVMARPPRLLALRVALALGAAGALVGHRVDRVREAHRWSIYEEAARSWHDAAFELHPIDSAYADAWPVWRFLDDGAPHELAVAFGWDGLGHNAFRLPLFGSRWQNRVCYVPVTADGSVVDHHGDNREASLADYGAWVRRLDERGVEFVVTLHPAGIERRWVEEHPERFARAAVSGEGRHSAWRVLRPAPGNGMPPGR